MAKNIHQYTSSTFNDSNVCQQMNGLIKFWCIHTAEYSTPVKMSELQFMYQSRNIKNILSKIKDAKCL